MSGPSIKGDMQEIKPGFHSISRDTPNGKALAFYNSTPDTQFNICYVLSADAKVEVLGNTKFQAPDKYALSVYPGETQEFIQGKIGGFKRTLSFGAPDKEWHEQQNAKVDRQIEDEIAAVKEIVKKNPKADGKYTAEYIADVCAKNRVKFVDLTFPPRAASLARDWEQPIGTFGWMRPAQYCPPDKTPQLFVDQIEPNDIDQGSLGDCYFLCAVACVSEFPTLVKDAFSLEQDPDCGIYRILVCKNGWWQVVVVDDYLPVKNGKPAFAKNREEPNELWVSLLEKAYAKLHGSYSAIRAGDAPQAIADILGAPYRKFKHMPEFDDKEQLFKTLLQCDEQDHIMCVGTPGTDTTQQVVGDLATLSKQYQEVGLATGHAYSLIRVKNPENQKLLMLRNPWGDEKEWNGDWSDDSPLWTPSLQKAVGFFKGNDGTFWMNWKDVLKYFDTGSVSYSYREWVQARVSGNFEECASDILVVLRTTSSVELWTGVHQRDSRGLPSGDKDRNYVGTLVSVLKEQPGGDVQIVAESNKGQYSDVRDVHANANLEGSSVYYILVQCFTPGAKSFVTSLFVSNYEAVAISFFSLAKKQRFSPASRFRKTDLGPKVAASYQLKGPRKDSEGMILLAKQGDSIDWSSYTATRQSTPAPRAAPAAQPAAVTGRPASQSVFGKPAAAPVVEATKVAAKAATQVKLNVIVLQGKNLISKDSNGLSDPFVTIKLKKSNGGDHPNEQRKETRYIKETLNPIWCESFQIVANSDEILHVKCYDKDAFGKDDMGLLDLPIAQIIKDLTPGGPGIIREMELAPPPSDVKGTLQLGFAWMI